MDKLRIRLLGGFEIASSCDAGAPALSRKAKALLAYLALQRGQPQSREKLSALFWEDSPEEQARTNLRQALSSIRKVLNGHETANLVADRNQISLVGLDMDLDVTEFEQLVAEATPEALMKAAALYQGDLLDGFSLKDDSFETWVRPEREHLRHLASNALTELTAHYVEVGDADHCVETAAQLLSQDSLHEAAHRILMRAYAAQGRHASALKQFKACRNILKRELGVEPEPETVALYHDIRKQRASASKWGAATETKLEVDCSPLPNGPSLATEQSTTVVAAAERTWRWPIVAAGLALLVIVIGVGLWESTRAPRTGPDLDSNMALSLPDRPSIAVLPFNNMSDDGSQDYFAAGMTEDLITDLSKISGLFVIARNSSFAYKGQQVKIRQVAEELGVRYVLEGSVRRSGDEVRINVQLIDVTTGGHIWADRYDGTLNDIFDLQDQVTEQIVAALEVSLTVNEKAEQARRATDNAAAHDAYLQGWANYNLGSLQDMLQALPFLEQAVNLDPEYSQAHAALASLYWDVFKNDWAFDFDIPSSRAESRANDHLEEALKSPTSLAHVLQARMLADWGFPGEAVTEANKAVALDENNAIALAGLADALNKADRPADGLGQIERAMRLDPHHPPTYLIILGAAYFGMERFEDAAATFERAVKRNPDNEIPLIYLASTYGHLGQINKAEDVIESANELRFTKGLGELSLERKSSQFYSPFQGEIDFAAFGGRPVQDRLRAGLSVIPAMTWHYLVTPHPILGAGNTWWEIESATQIDLVTAKFLHDKGVKFIDTSSEDVWKKSHIPGAVNLPYWRNDWLSHKRFKRETLKELVNKTEPFVLVYCFRRTCFEGTPAWEAAKAVNWGYENVFFLFRGTKVWVEAGYPVESAE